MNRYNFQNIIKETIMREQTLRILHFSDIHVGMPTRHLKWHKLLSKRSIGALHLIRGRAKYFESVEMKMKALAKFKEKNDIDIVINSGDYTALGLKEELQFAKKIVSPLMRPVDHYITVPGNHDIYVSHKKSQKQFSKEFASVLHSDLPQYAIEGHWPLVRLVNNDLAIIAINSARAHIFPWISSGFISNKQLESLEQILQDEKLKNRFVFIVTHYAVRLANGEDDTKLHGLTNAREFLSACKDIKAGAILSGHIHHTYMVQPQEINIPIYCAGSATMEGREGGWIYEFDGVDIRSTPLKWDGKRYYSALDH